MKLNLSQIMTIAALTLAIVAVCVGIIVQTFTPAVTQNASGNAVNPAPTVSLNPNLSVESSVGTDKDDSLAYAANLGENLYVFGNSNVGSLYILDKNLSLVGQKNYDGVFSTASVCEGGFIAALEKDQTTRLVWLNQGGEITAQSQAYQSQPVQKIIDYPDGEAVIFYSEGVNENSPIFRFYKNSKLHFERYFGSQYDLKIIDCYRIQDEFTLFYQYSSQFSRGGGYAKISPLSTGVITKNIELSYNYDFLSVCPYQNSYALLTSGEKGASILLLDKNLDRSEAVKLSESPALNGKISFDGTYYCFLGGDNGGQAFSLGADFSSKTELPTHSNALEIVDEINVNGKILWLSRVKDGFSVSNADGLFSKRLTALCCNPSKIIKTTSGVAIIGSGKTDGATIAAIGGSDVYLALLN